MGAQTSCVALPEHPIPWYRTKLSARESKLLHTTSDVQGAIQTVGFLAMLATWFCLALYFHQQQQHVATLMFVLLYGMQANFLINGMHELGHGFVFRSKWLNAVFLRIVSFLGWLHPDMFFSSHIRHHRYTQNWPLDQENPMPALYTLDMFLAFGFINLNGCYEIIGQTVRAAIGSYPTGHLGWLPGWEGICYPPSKPLARRPAMLWARIMLVGHLSFAVACVVHGCFLACFLLSFGPFYNGWLFWLCNSTQHVGLAHGTPEKPVTDFRLNTRTFYLGLPLVEFWYWHMNYHTEHHMFSAVPCYHLAALHQAIQHELPPTPHLVGMWRGIIDAIEKQRRNPAYVQAVTCSLKPGSVGVDSVNCTRPEHT